MDGGLTTLDVIVVIVYFAGMAVIGLICMLKIRHQEDYFLGGRSFGKIMQAFAAFGAGTGADNPVTLGRTVYTSGLSGIWSVLLWLFVTPFYWIFGVWYRRMRHLTLGDFFAERYDCRGLGAAYAVFGFFFYMVYLSVGFSAVTKVCEPLLGTSTFNIPWMSADEVPIEIVLVPVIGAVIIIYGVLGGLRAAYWTDLIQGIFILFLSVMLIPFGLWELVKKFGDPQTMGVIDGFRIMHQQVAPENFEIFGSPRQSEFPIYYIAAIMLINLVGIVVQPHFIATGGGSAKNETSARVGLVVGNFMKRFCTIGWALTALIVLALLAGDVGIARDPDTVWGIASVRILGPVGLGLVGLMLACLLAALMSSADCYMLVTSGLFVRNFYAAFFKPRASERHYVLVGRIVSFLMIAGGVLISLTFMNVFDQLKITWEMTVIFASVFWVGMFWRRATRAAAWLTVVFSATAFFVLPILLPFFPGLRENQAFTATNDFRTTIVTRPTAPADVLRRNAEIEAWMLKAREIEREPDPEKREEAFEELGERPAPLSLGETTVEEYTTGGKAIYWREGVKPVGRKKLVEVSREKKGETEVVVERYAHDQKLVGRGFFNLDFLFYDLVGLDLTKYESPMLETLRLPPKIITPFLVMVLLSFLTRRGDRGKLDRFYVKMKTPTLPDRESDRRELELSYTDPRRYDHKKLLPRSDLEFQKPTWVDILGFIASVAGAFAIVWLLVWVAQIGS